MDFEASSLSDQSYPIEVAWSGADGNVQSFLINPSTVSAWTDWNPESEEIHGIPRNQLLQQGYSPIHVCTVMQESLGPTLIYTDAPNYDEFWCRRLFQATQIPFPAWKFSNIDDLLCDMFYASKADCVTTPTIREFCDWLEELKYSARQNAPGEHRAAWDVDYLVELYEQACAQCATV